MPLSNEQIQEIVSQNRNKREIQDGVKHQERLKFHVETVLQKSDLSPYFRNDYLRWIGDENPEMLSKDKRERFEQLLRAPIQTVELTESIYSRLYRVFGAQDSYFNYVFTDDSLAADWAEYRDDKFWPTVGFEAMQVAIDSVWIAKLPGEQTTEYPEPQNKLVNIEHVIDIKNDHYNNCLYVIFQYGDIVYVYDDVSMKAFEMRNGRIVEGSMMEAVHDLGYTPARMMWSENLTAGNYINKESPITKSLSDLDWLLFHQTSKRNMDLVNAYPITLTYEEDGDYQDDDITDNEQRTHGKKPSGNVLAGAGSIVGVSVPREGEQDMMPNAVRFVSPQVENLKWHVDEEKRLSDKIFKSVVGTDQEVRNDAAKNETQIYSSFESQKSVLMRIKKNFEAIHKFADTTICKLRYGNRFIGCEIDYGTNFFLKTAEDLQEDLSKAKEVGGNEAIIDSIGDNILDTRYRDNKKSLQRASIINDLDPLPYKSTKDAIEIFKNGGVDKRHFVIKANLLNFVQRFEREQTDIVEFASLTRYSRKIAIINEEFKKYADELIQGTAGTIEG